MSAAADAQPSPGRQLYEAAAAGDAAAVNILVDQGEADVMWADEEGTTALMKAAENGHQEVVQLLLDGGAPWNQQDNDGYCAGEYATASRNQAIVELIMEWGVQAEMALMAAERWAGAFGARGRLLIHKGQQQARFCSTRGWLQNLLVLVLQACSSRDEQLWQQRGRRQCRLPQSEAGVHTGGGQAAGLRW